MELLALSVRLILIFSLVVQTHGNLPSIQLEFEQGTNMSLHFNFEYEEISVIQLKRNNDQIFRKYRTQVETARDKYISMSYDLDLNKVMFHVRDVDIVDSGEYTCFVTGRQKPPTYSVQVISSTRVIGISKMFEDGIPYNLNDTVSVVEGESLALVCRSNGGLRSGCDIEWYIESSGTKVNYRQNITQCDKYHEEGILKIDVTSVNLNDSRIICTSGGMQTSIFVRIKRKPYIVQSENMFVEGSRNKIFCVLNDTSEHPTFYWSLQDIDITQNATQQPIEISDGRYVWKSTLSLYSDRKHFDKLLRCKISNDEARSASLTLKIKFGASITNIFSTPSQHVDIHSSINITCVGAGYPELQFYWLKDCDGVDCHKVPDEPSFTRLNKTMFASTIALTTLTKTDGGSYKCRAYNGIGSAAEKDITIHFEEMGIIITDAINFIEGQVVNLLCVLKKRQTTSFIRWIIDHSIDITSNATQDEVQDQQGQTLLRSTLTFHPKRRYHATDLSCQWGRYEMYSDTILLNISYSAQQETNATFFDEAVTEIIIVAVIFFLLIVTAAVLFFVYRLRRNMQRDTFHPKPPETIGVQTLGKINAGVIPPFTRSSPVLYEVMAGYTTQVSPSECSVEDSRGLQDFIRDDRSDVTYLSHCSVTSSIAGSYQKSFSDKLKTLIGEDFDIETHDRGNRLSKHFVIGGDNSPILEEGEDLSPETYSIKNLNCNTDTNFILNLTIHDKLTQRGSIFFCNATLTKKTTKMNVTVKILSEFSRRHEKILFKKEITIVKNLDSHPNIAEVLGTCYTSRPNCIILEKILETNLKSLLLVNETNEELTETTEILRKYAEQVCSGMTFLSKNKCYHPNLRCEKVTVDKERICKLYDFVPADIFSAHDDPEHNQQDILQSGLIAPEIIQGKEHTFHTEVWGFGILLWEIYYYGLNQFERGTDNKIYGHLTGTDSLKRPESCPQEVYNLMLSCWCACPSNRPSFPELLDNIKEMAYKAVISTAV